MKRIVVEAICDLDSRELVETPAAYQNVRLVFENTEVELDLSDVNYRILRRAILPYLLAGTKPETPAKRESPAKQEAPAQALAVAKALVRGHNKTVRGSNLGKKYNTTDRQKNIIYNRGMREWAVANHYRFNTSPAGYYSYPKSLRDAYAKHVAETSVET